MELFVRSGIAIDLVVIVIIRGPCSLICWR
jgi:hypothetical protein